MVVGKTEEGGVDHDVLDVVYKMCVWVYYNKTQMRPSPYAACKTDLIDFTPRSDFIKLL